MAGDFDGDGDLDVVSAGYNKVAWHKNTDGLGAFGPEQIITPESGGARFLTFGDVDRDGDLDVIYVSSRGSKIAWLENENGQASFGPPQVITTDDRDARSVAVADLDADGDLDVLAALNSAIVWYENKNGTGDFGPELLISTDVHYARSVTVADVDGDGDWDVLSASSGDDKIAWYENRLAGDTDDDGDVDFADLVALSHHFGRTDAVWADGDFTGDRHITFVDFSILEENFGRKAQPKS